MQSRKDLRKRNHLRNLYLVIAGLVIVIAIIGGVVIHNNQVSAQAKARKFAVNHFNPSVNIDDVNVGKMTVAAATKKINRLAANKVQLKNDHVKLIHEEGLKTVSRAQVQAYFNKQHTAVPNNQNYVYKNKELVAAKNKLTRINHAQAVLNLAGKHYPLKADALIDEASYKNSRYHFENTAKLDAKIKEIQQQSGNLHKRYQISVPVGNKVNGKTITVKNQTYGWGVSFKKAKKAILNAFSKNQKQIAGSKILYGEAPNTYAHGYNKGNHGLGQNYVAVSIKNQELWVVRRGRVAVHLDDVVTGTLFGGKGDATPTGVWYIMYKQSPSVLRGNNDDGSKYASKVQYWMPFTLSGCGLHDASWRTDWSKTAYLNGGSHGCVNIQPSEIKSVWDNVLMDEAVIIYN